MKAIVFFDIHYGPVSGSNMNGNVPILGPFARDMHESLLEYAHHTGADCIVHGGDESVFHRDPDEHFSRAQEFVNTDRQYHGVSLRCIGNHDPVTNLEPLGFKSQSHVHDVGQTRILIDQPVIAEQQGRIHYEHAPDTYSILCAGGGASSILWFRHFGLDRVKRGYAETHVRPGYMYKDSRIPLCGIPDPERRIEILEFHGHEHRYTETFHNGVRCIGMPSITQGEKDGKTACGVFVEVSDDTQDGTLRVQFKKIVLCRDMACVGLRVPFKQVVDIPRNTVAAYQWNMPRKIA